MRSAAGLTVSRRSEGIVNTRLDLPPVIQTIDGRSCEVRDKGRKLPPKSVSVVTALRVAAAELESNSKVALDRRLDHALEETFPASDPISVICD